MIFQTLKFLELSLNRYIQGQEPGSNGLLSSSTFVTLGEVSLVDGPHSTQVNDKLLLSLVYLQEETTLKNSSPYIVRDQSIELKNPPVFLNLGIIFAANFPADYSAALIRISQVVAFFQSKSRFSFSSAPVTETKPFILTPDQKNDLEVTVDMMKLSLDELSHLWGILKTRELPHVMYKVRVVEIEEDRKITGGGLITEIQTTFE